eukprot:7802060-Pyramimonas_sp.AAC.1
MLDNTNSSSTQVRVGWDRAVPSAHETDRLQSMVAPRGLANAAQRAAERQIALRLNSSATSRTIGASEFTNGLLGV